MVSDCSLWQVKVQVLSKSCAWYRVFDYSEDDSSLPAPHWSVLPPSEWHRWQVCLDDDDSSPPEFALALPLINAWAETSSSPRKKNSAPVPVEVVTTLSAITRQHPAVKPLATIKASSAPLPLSGQPPPASHAHLQPSPPQPTPISAPTGTETDIQIEAAPTADLPKPSPAPAVPQPAPLPRPARPWSAKGTRTPLAPPLLSPRSGELPEPGALPSHAPPTLLPSPLQAAAVADGRTGEPVDEAVIGAMHTLLLGGAGRDWPEAWRRQGFAFSCEPAVPFGLHQRRGGTCGVMAAVQAFVLRFLRHRVDDWLQSVSPTDGSAALVDALTSVLWRAGTSSGCSVVLSSSVALPPRRAIAATLTRFHLPSRLELQKFLKSHLASFAVVDGCGVILLLYSVILSIGVETIQAQMDRKETTLIGAHGYCTQELVNLLMTGVASSNVFDGEQVARSTNPTRTSVVLVHLDL